MDSQFFKVVSALADIITIVLFTYGIIFSLFQRTRSVIGFQISQFMIKSFRLGIIMFVGILIFQLSMFPYGFSLLLLKGNVVSEYFYWETGKEIQHLAAYFITISLMLPIFWMIATTIWTLSFNYVTGFINLLLPSQWNIKVTNIPILQILRAEYGTDVNKIDVTDKVRTMVNNNSLTITSSNDLAGDPHFGVTKTLTIEYRFNNKLFTEKIIEANTKKIP